MNNLAVALNDVLEGTVAPRVFSDLGRRMYFPKGIVAQSAEAKEKAHRFNATVGMAYANGHPMTLPLIRELTGDLSTEESVAYAPTAGIPALRDRWRQEMVRKNPTLAEVTTTRPSVVPGLTAGLAVVSDLFAEESDVLLLPDLFWGNYRLMFSERRQTQLREFAFFDDHGAFNRSAFADGARAAAGAGKLMVLLNFPNNPAGFTPTREDATFIRDTLVSLADSVPVIVICDDAYFGLFYDDAAFPHSLFSLLAASHTNLLAIKVDGATKEDFAWGFRVGFVTIAFKGMTHEHAAALEQKLNGAIRSMVSNSSRLSQSLILRVLDDTRYAEQKQEAFDLLSNRYATLTEILRTQAAEHRAPMLEPLPCNSGYFMSFRCRGLSAESLRQALLERGVGTIAVRDEYLRVAFAGIDAQDLPALYEEIFQAAETLA
ncbi:MAG TPA: aminotransferase class I/II-fold pyridoxal phosphate-dependent enzyme [Alkalispirochaeta sp.]|nr:aminotransferase class I/II-fold pyridoxal phosphate-dependent enzyme [Alkalispirochaeta sp.]